MCSAKDGTFAFNAIVHNVMTGANKAGCEKELALLEKLLAGFQYSV